MIVAETRIFHLGHFTIQQRPRFDNYAFAVYIVLSGNRVVGKQFSVPTLSDCQWLERQVAVDKLVYAEHSSRLTEHSVQSIGCHRRHGPGRKRVSVLVEEEEST